MNGLEVSVRFIHLASVLLLVGIFGFDLLVGRPALRAAGAKISADLQSFSKSRFRVACWSLWLAASTAILGLFIKIATAAGLSLAESFNPSAIVSFLIETQFGTVWLVRMALLCLLASVLSPDLFGWLNRNSSQLCIAGSILSGTLLMSLAVAGHASAAEGEHFSCKSVWMRFIC